MESMCRYLCCAIMAQWLMFGNLSGLSLNLLFGNICIGIFLLDLACLRPDQSIHILAELKPQKKHNNKEALILQSLIGQD